MMLYPQCPKIFAAGRPLLHKDWVPPGADLMLHLPNVLKSSRPGGRSSTQDWVPPGADMMLYPQCPKIFAAGRPLLHKDWVPPGAEPVAKKPRQRIVSSA